MLYYESECKHTQVERWGRTGTSQTYNYRGNLIYSDKRGCVDPIALLMRASRTHASRCKGEPLHQRERHPSLRFGARPEMTKTSVRGVAGITELASPSSFSPSPSVTRAGLLFIRARLLTPALYPHCTGSLSGVPTVSRYRHAAHLLIKRWHVTSTR